MDDTVDGDHGGVRGDPARGHLDGPLERRRMSGDTIGGQEPADTGRELLRGQPDVHPGRLVELGLGGGQRVLGRGGRLLGIRGAACQHGRRREQQRAQAQGHAGAVGPHGHTLSRPCHWTSRETGPATATTGCAPGTPDPSRRPVGSGRSTAAPLAADARAGPSPAHANTRVSSPLRKRWQRTPPVPRPLAGYSANGVTLTAPGSVPGSAVLEPDEVTTTAESSTSNAPKNTTDCFGASRTPAMPPPERPWGRTAPAAKCSSCASEVTKQSSSSPVLSSTAPTTSSPSASRITSQASRFPSTSGLTRLTTPARVPRA